jgi:hypothetical protein
LYVYSIILLEETLSMTHRGLLCLLLGTLAWGQAANTNTAPAAPAAAAQSSSAPDAKPAEVAPDAVVITIPALCEGSADMPAPPDCKTGVTRAEFESVINAVAPTMPAVARKQFATRYAMGLVMASEAHKMGLDKGEHYDQMLKLSRMQVLMQMMGDAVREKAAQVSDQEIADYYKANTANFEEISLQRLVIPHSKQLAPSKIKLTPAATKKRQEDADAAMKTEAGLLRKRAAAGEPFAKLQAEAFTFAGIKAKAPDPDMGKVRKNNVPVAHQSVLALKEGTVSDLITDASGYYVYKVGAKETLTQDQVKEEIVNTLKGQKTQEAMQSLQKKAAPTLNDSYFAPPAPQGEATPSKPPSGPGSSEHK